MLQTDCSHDQKYASWQSESRLIPLAFVQEQLLQLEKFSTTFCQQDPLSHFSSDSMGFLKQFPSFSDVYVLTFSCEQGNNLFSRVSSKFLLAFPFLSV